MGDIAKGVLGGAWTLLTGWILPTALNLGVFFYAVAPSLRHIGPIERFWPGNGKATALLLLCLSLLLGLVLNALQNPLYRILEGYLLWPERLAARACARSRRVKHTLRRRLGLIRLEHRAREGELTTDEAAELASLRADATLARAARRDRDRSAVRRALLREKLNRYPADDAQLAPTRLGNAIRRLEEYGYDRFRLDTQVLWNELTATAPEQVRRQVDLARANVDFFVALLTGHLAVAATALAALGTSRPDVPALLLTTVLLGALIPVWYRSAVTATDEWAATVRALVNVGRVPLAGSLGLALPATLESERRMWTLVAKLTRLPYHERAGALDAFRAEPGEGRSDCSR